MEENTEQIPLDAMGFLLENTISVEQFVPLIIQDLDAMGEDWTQVKLLDYMYENEDKGITTFQNMAAAALLLLAIERKKKE